MATDDQVMDPQGDENTPVDSPLASSAPDTSPKTPAQVQSQLQGDRAAQLQRAQQIQSILNAKYGQYQQGANALKDLLQDTAARLRATAVGPSQAERYGQFAAALSAPTRSGTFAERMGNVGAASAQSLAQAREQELAKQELLAKYGMEAGQLGLNASQMGIQQMSSQENNANNRLSSLDTAISNANKPSATVVMGSNGQYVPNQALIDAKGQMSAAEAAARMRAQLAGISDPNTQNGLIHTAQMIVDRKIPMPTISTRSPQGMAMSNALTGMIDSLDPNYNAQDFPIAKDTRLKFTTGPQGDTTRSLNVAMTHLEAMRQWADALKNGDVRTVNRVSNWLSNEFGHGAPVTYDTAKQTVASEATKAINGAKGSALGDRVEQAEHFSSANSPEEQNDAIDALQVLMGGQLHGLRQQFRTGLRGVSPDKADTEFNTRLSPEVLNLEQRSQGGTNIHLNGGGNKPTDKDIAYLKAHPETAPKFKAHFGSLPEGFSG